MLVKRRNKSTIEDEKIKNTVRVKCACLLATYLIDLQRYMSADHCATRATGMQRGDATRQDCAQEEVTRSFLRCQQPHCVGYIMRTAHHTHTPSLKGSAHDLLHPNGHRFESPA
jgi:hypothetical protein